MPLNYCSTRLDNIPIFVQVVFITVYSDTSQKDWNNEMNIAMNSCSMDLQVSSLSLGILTTYYRTILLSSIINQTLKY